MRILWILTLLLLPVHAAAVNPLTSALSDRDALTAEQIVHLAYLLREADRADEAKSLFEELSSATATKTEAVLALAILQTDARSVSTLCRRLGKTPLDSDVSGICHGHLFQLTDQQKRAADIYQQISKKDGDVRAGVELGFLHSAQGRHGDAVIAFRRAIERGAGYRAWQGLGIALENQGSHRNAAAALKKAVELEPRSALSQYHYGRILASGRIARQHMENALILRPNWVDALAAMGHILLNGDDPEAAISMLDRGIAINSTRADLYTGRARAYLRTGAVEKARKDLQMARDIHPDAWDILFLLASADIETGNDIEANRTVEKAVALSKNNPQAHREAALFFYQTKRHTRANTHFRKLLEFDPDNSEALVYLGDIACERKMFSEGREYYHKALKSKNGTHGDSDIQERIRKCR